LNEDSAYRYQYSWDNIPWYFSIAKGSTDWVLNDINSEYIDLCEVRVAENAEAYQIECSELLQLEFIKEPIEPEIPEANVYLITEYLSNPTRYLPYSVALEADAELIDGMTLRYTVSDGRLPSGMELNESTGVIGGAPTATGTSTFTVTVEVLWEGEVIASHSRELTLTVETNIVEDLEEENDYEIKERLPEVIDVKKEEEVVNQNFASEGEFDEFADLWLDGVKLDRAPDQEAWDNGEGDYIAVAGSTILTIRAQVFTNLKPGTHTIVAEFRTVDEDGEKEEETVKRTAQNFTIEGKKKPSSIIIRPKEEKPKTIADIFADIAADDWFFESVAWAYKKGVMVGVSSDSFAPHAQVNAAMIATSLARLEGADLGDYAVDAWYTAPVMWAQNKGLISADTDILHPMTRGQLAVMLKKYLDFKGMSVEQTGDPVVFEDAQLMTPEEEEAFRVLYKFGITAGVGAMKMDASGIVTRSQFAAMLSKISDCVE